MSSFALTREWLGWVHKPSDKILTCWKFLRQGVPRKHGRAIFVWPWKMVSDKCSLFVLSAMDEMIKTWTPRFPAMKRRHCSIGQSCWSITSKRSIDWLLEISSGMKFFQPSVGLTKQKSRAFVSVRWTNQIALFPFVCCFCFVRAFSFQGHTQIALTVRKFRRLVLQRSSCEQDENIERVPCERSVQSNFSASRKFVRCRVNLRHSHLARKTRRKWRSARTWT